MCADHLSFDAVLRRVSEPSGARSDTHYNDGHIRTLDRFHGWSEARSAGAVDIHTVLEGERYGSCSTRGEGVGGVDGFLDGGEWCYEDTAFVDRRVLSIAIRTSIVVLQKQRHTERNE